MLRENTVFNEIPAKPVKYTESAEETALKKLKSALEFTREYKNNMDKPLPIREALCLKKQFPALFREIKDYDLIAGRVYYYPYAGFGVEFDAYEKYRDKNLSGAEAAEWEKTLASRVATSNTGFCYNYHALMLLKDKFNNDPEINAQVDEIIGVWWDESTRYKYNLQVPGEISRYICKTGRGESFLSCFFRISCFSVDFDRLLRVGLSGLRAQISEAKIKREALGEDVSLYVGMLIALDTVSECCLYYKAHTLLKAETERNPKRKAELCKMAEALENISADKPRTFREAVQLFWIYNILTSMHNYGRMDVYLGDFYVNDIKNGVITEADAMEIIKSLWQIISEQKPDGWNNTVFNTRIIVGGRGRRNEENADAFALAAIEATKNMLLTEPQLTLRFYDGQNPALMDKALESLAAGATYPGLYYDDAYIEWAQKAFRVSYDEAATYLLEGCGEIILDNMVGSPNTVLKYTSALDIVLHNGLDTEAGERNGLAQGGLETFDTYEKLAAAVKKQIDFTVDIAARRHALEIKVLGENVSYLFLSMLSGDCIDRNKALMAGGVKYLGGIIETFGHVNLSDSMYAIKKLVYEQKVVSLEKMVEMVDGNFEGYDKELQMIRNIPKYGNDDYEADAFYTEWNDFLCEATFSKAEKHGLNHFLNCALNAGGIYYGSITKASPDGRRNGDAFAVGNGPTAGMDKSGLTAVLNSMTKHSKLHAGYVHNLKTSKKLYSPENLPKLKALLETYFRNGGEQLMITTLDRGDLENALREPEKYANLLVRIGGWTAKFVELPKHYQREILNRTCY